MAEISKAEFSDWKNHIVTQAVFGEIATMREDGLRALAAGVWAEELGKSNLVIGKINALTSILNISLGEEEEEGKDNE